jgi:transposase
MLEALTSLLDLHEEFEVLEAQEDRKAKVRRFTLSPRLAVGVCPHCGDTCPERHLCHDREVVDLPMGAYASRLSVRMFQFRCRSCDRFFTPRYAALAEGAHATERFLGRMAELVKHADLCNAAAYLGVPERTLSAWYYEYVGRLERDAGRDLKPVTSLGIDELSLKNGTSSSASC